MADAGAETGDANTGDASPGSTLIQSLDELLMTLNVSIAAIAVCEVDHGWRLRIDPMDEPIIHFVLRGGGALHAEGHRTRLESNSFVLVPAGCGHSLETSSPARSEKRGLSDCVAVGDGMLRLHAGTEKELVTVCGAVSATHGHTLGFFDHLGLPVAVAPRHTETVRRAFAQIIEELSSPVIGARAITAALMKQCIVQMVRGELDRSADSRGWLWTLRDERLARVVAVLLDRPAEDHSVEALAAMAAMSRSAFSKRFVESFGMSPIEFLTLVRLNQAANMLARTRVPIKVIAGSVGYASRSYFSRAFRARFGTDPSAFRDRFGSTSGTRSWRPLKGLKGLFAGSERSGT